MKHEDHHTNTVSGAAAFERNRARHDPKSYAADPYRGGHVEHRHEPPWIPPPEPKELGDAAKDSG